MFHLQSVLVLRLWVNGVYISLQSAEQSSRTLVSPELSSTRDI